MQLGMIGLGRMGSNMVQRLLYKGIECVVHDTNAAVMAPLQDFGAVTSPSLETFVKQLKTPRIIWLMLPAAVVDAVLTTLTPLLTTGDIIIDGGNSYYKDALRRATALNAAGIHSVDVGTSGGVFGLERGYCLMIGGEQEVVEYLDPIFAALAPGEYTVPKTSTQTDQHSTSEKGYLHCGPQGAGHFVKMVHNGIEYGMMAAYAEGMSLLNNVSLDEHAFDLPEIAEVWRRGSVISSWLLDLTANALHDDPNLDQYNGYVADSGEGRWTVMTALDEAIPVPVLSAALYARFNSRGQADFANKVLSAMRHQFGGHIEPPDK